MTDQDLSSLEKYLGPYLLGPNNTNQGIYTGDSKVLAKEIPDESIDLVFCDPIYDRIDDYRWLAETATRILRPDRACLVFCGIGYLPETLNALRAGRLRYRWQCVSVIYGRNNRGEYGIYNKWASLLWFEKGRCKPSGWAFDVHQTTVNHRSGNNHAWQKHPDVISNYLRILPGIVLDPFCGGGTIPAACKMLRRRYLAFEIDPETAEIARERVRNTQPPLFVPQPEQVAMFEEAE